MKPTLEQAEAFLRTRNLHPDQWPESEVSAPLWLAERINGLRARVRADLKFRARWIVKRAREVRLYEAIGPLPVDKSLDELEAALEALSGWAWDDNTA